MPVTIEDPKALDKIKDVMTGGRLGSVWLE
jgi:hypothetical protein